jgi:hypothetical protein
MPEYSGPVAVEENRSNTLLSRAPGRAILVGVDRPGIDWPVEESLPAARTPLPGGRAMHGEGFWEVTRMICRCGAEGGHYGRTRI